MGEQQDHHRGLEINPIIVGLLGLIVGAIIVVILHFIIVSWCKNSSSDPPEENRRIPISQSQSQNRSRANAQPGMPSSTSTSNNSMVRLIVLSKEDMCSICLGEFMEGDEVRVLSQCMHIFHVPCIDMWLHSHPNCPLCRADTTMTRPQRRLIGLLTEPHRQIHDLESVRSE